ncbi:hypothetical protein ACIRRA_29350 [Nocardia sp. NPDC101769]|uniref:hypothetical protein n=1 Tax=Nocardia sp. NPDC101769 TaxID=3364333 RepID=UPI0037F7BBE9
MSARGRERGWARLVPAGYSLVLALIVLGPLLGSGYLLLRDAVSTPRSFLTDSALGLGDAAPRAVPQDALIAVGSTVVDGGLLVKAILLAALWLAGWGAACLARDLLRVSLGPQLVAATVAIWSPYVAERLLQGHWSLLTGYAALPWIALLATRLRARSATGTTARSTTDTTARADGAEAARSPAPTATPPISRPGRSTLLDAWAGRSGVPGTRAGRAGALGTWAGLAGCLAAAGLTPTGSLLAGLVALLLVGKRNLPATAALWILSAAPWLTATALSGAGAEPSDPVGIAAFAARAEPWLGTLGSLSGLGGIWNSTAVPGSRTTFFALVATVLLLALVATGVRAVLGAGTDSESRSGAAAHHLDRTDVRPDDTAEPGAAPDADVETRSGAAAREPDRTGVRPNGTAAPGGVPDGGSPQDSMHDEARVVRRRLVWLAVAAIVLPALGATGWGLSAGEFLVTRVPGAGLLRDTQKFVALAVPAYALCAAAGCRVVGRWISAMVVDGVRAESPRARTGGAAVLFLAILLLTLPDLAWGVGGALRPVQYPAGWQRVAAEVDAPGDVAVLPGGMFRKFRYSGSAPVLDPAPRMLKRDVLQTGELPVRGGVVSGEGERARKVENLLLQGGSANRLAELGVGWVLVEGGTPGPMGASKTTLAQLNPVYADRDMQLYRVPGDIAAHDASAANRHLSGAAHLLWAALLVGGFLTAAIHSAMRRSIPREAERESHPDHDNAD